MFKEDTILLLNLAISYQWQSAELEVEMKKSS